MYHINMEKLLNLTLSNCDHETILNKKLKHIKINVRIYIF